MKRSTALMFAILGFAAVIFATGVESQRYVYVSGDVAEAAVLTVAAIAD